MPDLALAAFLRPGSPFSLALAALSVLFLAAAGTGAAPRSDCNANGVDDAADIALGTSADANANGVPDECEPPFARSGPRASRSTILGGPPSRSSP